MVELRLNGAMNLLFTWYRIRSGCIRCFKRHTWVVELPREMPSDIDRIGLTGEKRELLQLDDFRTDSDHAA